MAGRLAISRSREVIAALPRRDFLTRRFFFFELLGESVGPAGAADSWDGTLGVIPSDSICPDSRADRSSPREAAQGLTIRGTGTLRVASTGLAQTGNEVTGFKLL